MFFKVVAAIGQPPQTLAQAILILPVCVHELRRNQNAFKGMAEVYKNRFSDQGVRQ